jgi:hypothetical protein
MVQHPAASFVGRHFPPTSPRQLFDFHPQKQSTMPFRVRHHIGLRPVNLAIVCCACR